MDLPGREPLDLLAEVEEVLGIDSSPLFWPIGQGADFRGIVDIRSEEVLLFSKSEKGGAGAAIMEKRTLKDLGSLPGITSDILQSTMEGLELIREAGNPFDPERFLAGKQTPVFFGSALTNFGVEPFFDAFSRLAPAPHSRRILAPDGSDLTLDPARDPFSGYVFKIQANMDLKHRDSMAFLRVCSGKFSRDLVVKNSRTGKEIRLSRSHNMFGGDRQTVDAAFPGDIIGVVNPGAFSIGDSVSVGGRFSFPPLPKFPPEVVCRIRPKDALKRKAFEKGMNQFRSEGAVLILEPLSAIVQGPLVAAVGILQFEVLEFRLKSEYGVETVRETLPYRHGVWVLGDTTRFDGPSGA
ncbi:MAG: peptide chain release factor 3, partial [Bdellovibrionales bacterium]|nr:peptide chain release factor 3 [Bdellovibrionales bacterium]